MKFFLLLLVGLILLLLAGHLFAQKSVRSEVTISASPEAVWKVLTEVDDYPNWNPTMRVLEGAFQEGAEVKYEFTDGDGNKSEIGAKVKRVREPELINQSGGISGVITFNHFYRIEPVSAQPGLTRVIIHEEYAGFYVWFWNPDSVERAYEKLNLALQDRVEQTRLE